MCSFVHLHVHSYYSLLDGLSSPQKLAKEAKNMGMTALALTDHGVMYGAVEFYKECKNLGIKPIIGVEAYIALKGRKEKSGQDDARYGHVVLLAKNLEGYKNLIQLTTKAHLEGFYYKPRIDHELLNEYSGGLIATSACMKGEIPMALQLGDYNRAKDLVEKYKSYFDDGDFYLEIQYHETLPEQQKVNNLLVKLSKETNTPLVATNDVHYAKPSNRRAHDVLLCIQTGKTVHDENRMSYDSDFSMRSPELMAENFKDIPESISNTVEIANKCSLEIPLDLHLLPSFDTGDTSSAKYLRDLCIKGIDERYTEPEIHAKAIERLDYELEVIDKMGFNTYFLIVWDFIKYAKDEGIVVGPGRGSAAGSIVAYSLFITDVDPLKYNLLFERFLNPSRISMPDIDIDFADDRREEVLNYVIDKYGYHNVAQIITFGTMGAKAAIRDSGRALGFAYSDVDRIAKMVPTRPGITLADAMKEEKELKDAYDSEENSKQILDTAFQLEGVVRHSSTHACAVVISENPLTEYTPLQTGSKGESTLVTQYSMKPIEKIGLLKMDFLGLKNLTILERTQKIIKRTRGKFIKLPDIPLNDSKTFKLMTKAETIGIFQLESQGIRRYLKQLKPTEFEDIIAMVSLYRPGSLDMKVDGNRTMVDIYIDRKHGKLESTYLDPSLEPILKETYGVIIYQEQILKIAQEFAGYTLGEADLLRRAIGKKIKEEIDAQKEIFVEGAVRKGKTRQLALKVFSYIEPFARYGFNKSHAACYALIAYQTAYFKAHYPVEFLAACLACDLGNNDRVSILMEDAGRLGIEILPPSVDESLKNFTVTDDFKNIRFGLAAIKNIGEGPAMAIIEARKETGKFKTFEDFLSHVGSKVANRKVLESLAKCGALDHLADRNQVLENIEQILSFVRALNNDSNMNQTDLFSALGGGSAVKPILQLKDVVPASSADKLKWEKELIGMYVSEHPLKDDKYKKLYSETLITIDQLGRGYGNKKIKIGGIVTAVKQIFTKKGDKMCFATIEDYTGNIEMVVFNGVYMKYSSDFVVDNKIICEGKISFKSSYNNSGEEAKFIVDSVHKFDADNVVSQNNNSVHLLNLVIKNDLYSLELPSNVKMNHLVKMKDILKNYKGDKILNLMIPNKESGTAQCVRVPFKVSFTDELHSKLDKIFK